MEERNLHIGQPDFPPYHSDIHFDFDYKKISTNNFFQEENIDKCSSECISSERERQNLPSSVCKSLVNVELIKWKIWCRWMSQDISTLQP